MQGAGGESQWPDYPWVMKGPEPKDFMGNEFMLWLWHEADAKTGVIPTEDGDVTILFDKSLDLDCAYGESGKDSLRGTGPSRMPEAMDALRSGKVPRKAGLIMDARGSQYSLTLAAENLAVAGLQDDLRRRQEQARPRGMRGCIRVHDNSLLFFSERKWYVCRRRFFRKSTGPRTT